MNRWVVMTPRWTWGRGSIPRDEMVIFAEMGWMRDDRVVTLADLETRRA